MSFADAAPEMLSGTSVAAATINVTPSLNKARDDYGHRLSPCRQIAADIAAVCGFTMIVKMIIAEKEALMPTQHRYTHASANNSLRLRASAALAIMVIGHDAAVHSPAPAKHATTMRFRRPRLRQAIRGFE